MKKILIVDDATFMQKVTSGILSRKYETICASSGKEALEIYERERPDMILTDLVMPNMTGLELQQRLQQRYDRQIPIIFMTADEREDNESRGLEGGAMDYIRKPFKPEVLLRRVDNVMRSIENVERIRGLKAETETDPMTGLLNKAYATKVLVETCEKSAGTLMMVDLDSFKLVNDIYGHGMGDSVLIRFAEIIRSVIRTTDIAGRMGGDEFIVFCKDIRDEAIIADKARAINEAILHSAKELMGEDMGIPLGASVGAVAVPDEGTVFEVLYKKADKALYRVKQNGKHGYAIYREEGAAEAEREKSAAGTLDTIRKILEERNRKKGAYELSFDNFKSVYRYLIRALENYHRKVELVLFTVYMTDAGAAAGAKLDDVTERFGRILGESLRRSDIYTKNGNNQYMVLLSEMEDGNDEPVMKRVLELWERSAQDAGASISYETVLIYD